MKPLYDSYTQEVEGETQNTSCEVLACKRLWASVMLSSITDYARYRHMQEYGSTKALQHRSSERLQGERAYSWIFLNEGDSPKSFDWVCAVLGVDANRVKTRIKANWRTLCKASDRNYGRHNKVRS